MRNNGQHCDYETIGFTVLSLYLIVLLYVGIRVGGGAGAVGRHIFILRGIGCEPKENSLHFSFSKSRCFCFSITNLKSAACLADTRRGDNLKRVVYSTTLAELAVVVVCLLLQGHVKISQSVGR
jgi:hypothetical protein